MKLIDLLAIINDNRDKMLKKYPRLIPEIVEAHENLVKAVESRMTTLGVQ